MSYNETASYDSIVSRDNTGPGVLNFGTVGTTGAIDTDTTAGVLTYTAAQMIAGGIVRDPNGAARIDVFPTAALIQAAMTNPLVGDSFMCSVTNIGAATENLNCTAGAGNTAIGDISIADGTSALFLFRVTDVTTPAMQLIRISGPAA